MSKTPLNEPEWDNFDRALLASAELDTPESGALGRARRALAAATLGSAVLISASTSLGASSGAGAAGASLVGVSLVSLSKALLVGAVVGVGFVGVVNGGFSAPPEKASLEQSIAAPRSSVEAALPAAKSAFLASPADEMQTVAVPEVAPRERNLPAAKLPSTPARVTSLGVEVELLDRARSALVRKDPQAALAELDRYAQLAIERSLGREANLLRIEALRDLGRAATAVELAKRLADEDPQGLTGQRARELIR